MRAALESWGLASLEDVACLLVTELVANMVMHAPSTSELVIRRHGDVVRVAVADADPRPPVLRRRSPMAATGRGLALVDALATRWGYDPVGKGKAVWFELRGDGGVPLSAEVPRAPREPGHEPAVTAPARAAHGGAQRLPGDSS
jgi:hypothetical protein